MKKLCLELRKDLLNASDYREFIKIFCKRGYRPLSYSALALRAGFSSRSYVRDVIEGKRRLTLQSVPKFVKGMGLAGEWKDFFQLLVGEIESDSRLGFGNSDDVRTKLEKLRRRLMSLPDRTTTDFGADRIGLFLRNPHCIEVYAACGAPEKGVGLEQLLGRTKISAKRLEEAIQQLEKLGLVQWNRKEGRIVPLDFHLSLNQAQKTELWTQLYLKTLNRLARCAAQNMNSNEKLFHQSVFWVKTRELPALKEALRAVLLQFVDQSIDDDGDEVVHLVAALF